MKPIGYVLVAGLSAGSAQAQFVQQQDLPPSYLKKSEPADPFSNSFHPYPRTYATNDGASPNDQLFKGLFKTDPRLLFGVALTPTLALEAGYVNLLDQGFHRIDERNPGDTDGVLGARGSSLHAAVRYTAPLSERLSVFGKLGVAYSERPAPSPEEMARLGMSGKTAQGLSTVDKGMYTGVGAKYKLNDRATISGEFANHGDARKWGRQSNSSGLRAKLKMGF